eukprot:29446-Pelagococcus_subviridis.AAC.2
MRRGKSLRNGVHHANAVVWGPVYRTHLQRVRGGIKCARFPKIDLRRRLFHEQRGRARAKVVDVIGAVHAAGDASHLA